MDLVIRSSQSILAVRLNDVELAASGPEGQPARYEITRRLRAINELAIELSGARDDAAGSSPRVGREISLDLRLEIHGESPFAGSRDSQS